MGKRHQMDDSCKKRVKEGNVLVSFPSLNMFWTFNGVNAMLIRV